MTLPSTVRWYDALPDVTVPVECGGEEHRVTWRRGKLVLEDHDLTAERTMIVFGGEPCACLQVLKMWGDQFSMAPEQFSQMRQWLGPNAFLAPAEFDLVRELGMVLSWERAWRRGRYLTKHERLLDNELRVRALGPLREHLTVWKQRVGARVISSVEVKLIRSDQPPRLSGTMNKVTIRATAELAGSWPVEVWGRGVAVVDDAFVLEVLESARPELVVRAVRWDQRPGDAFVPVESRARLRPDAGGGWRLAWNDR